MKQTFFVHQLPFHFTYEEEVSIELSLEKADGGISLYRLAFTWPEEVYPKPISLYYRFPTKDVYTMWDPLDKCRDLNVRFHKRGITQSRLAAGMPLKGLVSKSGNNAYLLALSDVKSPISIKLGLSGHEELPTEDLYLTFFTALTGPFRHYETLLRIDERTIPFDLAVQEAKEWFCKQGYPPAYVPEEAKDPVYSTWYSYEKTISAEAVIQECKEAAKLGMKTVIIDDGWQTDEPNGIPYYARCGDWEPSPSKFPNMRAMTDQIHALGMKVMLWFSVPFIGYQSKIHSCFEGRYLYHLDSPHECSVLDPRYPEIRSYLTNTYEKAVTEWNLDGLKLDFIDRFKANGEITDEMDTVSVEDAVELLLKEISTRLRTIRPDILLEFRQPYFGPVISAYGNMMRVWDCPLDGVLNKNQSINLRLATSGCAVHADMIYWTPDETPEGEAVQLLSTLFSVPQISVPMASLTVPQRTVLSHYLTFWNEHRNTLCSPNLRVKLSENGYGYAYARYNGEKIALASSWNELTVESEDREIFLFNITDEERIILRNPNQQKLLCQSFDCMGRPASDAVSLTDRLSECPVPYGGMLKVTVASR
ncbi:MAG: alpha-galactosidase [Clostridia bacterium]|nr:alpha-galactosidase [Clostridia bacterium]